MNKRKGFTLIELLVVISIIAMLMAILMPVLRKVKDQAKAAMCMSNLRQIGLSATVYAQNNDGFIPRGTPSGKGFTGSKYTYDWWQLFMPFTSRKSADGDFSGDKFFRCPSHPVKREALCYVVNNWGLSPVTGVIDNLNGDLNKESENAKLRLDSYKRLSSTIYLADSEDGSWRPIITLTSEDQKGVSFRRDVHRLIHLPVTDEDVIVEMTPQWEQDRAASPRVARKRHRKGSNLLFADWHVTYMPAADLAGRKGGGVSGEINAEAIELWRFKK